MRNLIFFLLLLTALPASSQVVAGNYTPGFYSSVNYVKNPSCILNDANITDASGIVSRTTASPITEGLKASCLIDGTASAQVVKFTMSSFDTDLDGGNCEASFSYRGDASLYKVYVESPVSTKISADVQLTDTGSTTRTERINFPCGVRADAKALVLETTGASPAAIKVGKAYGGKATNVGSTQLISEWTSYTPTVTALGSGAVSNYTAYGKWRQVGDTMEVDISIQFSAASSAFGVPGVSIPSDYTIDTSKLPTSVTLGSKPLGHVSVHDSGVSSYSYNGKASYYSTTIIELEWWNTTNTANTSITNTVPFTFASGDEIYTRFSVPIVGWTAQTLVMPPMALDLTGMLFYTGSSTCPANSLAANGAAVSRTTYSTLFSRIGTTFGVGDGSTTFNVPDARGIFVRGVGSQTISSITYTGTLGAKSADQMQGHFHQIIGETTDGGSGGGVPRFGGGTGRDVGVGAPRTDGTNGTPRTGSQTHPANIGMTPCISIAPSFQAILANSVSTSATNGLKTESFSFTCSGSSSISVQLGGTSWVSSIGNIAAGVCAVGISAGTFSGSPQCQVTWTGGGSNAVVYSYAETSSGFNVGAVTDTGAAATSFTGKAMCVGPR